jgi:hypothetical protein
MSMGENASYIERELPNVTLPDDLRAQATELCSNLIGTDFDIISELFDFDDILSAPTPDAAVVATRIERIVRWLSRDLPKMHQLIAAVQSAAETNPDYGLACMLLTESAATILHHVQSRS